MKKCDTFEPTPFSVTDKSQPIRMPSYDRVIVAITVTAVIMVICAVLVSIYNAKYGAEYVHYPVGTGSEAEIYKDPDAFGGLTVIGKQISVLEFTDTVERGDWATLRIQGEPNTEYDITVFLKSGPSSNSALIPKKTDEHGVVEWKWRVYKGTSLGKFKVVVNSVYENNICVTYAEMYLTIKDEE